MSFFRKRENTHSRRTDDGVRRVAQLDVDVFETEQRIIVYAHVAGADMHDISISIEGKNDVIIIEGTRVRPEVFVFGDGEPTGAFVTEECVWSPFYRKIVLPERVDAGCAEAKIVHGVLVISLPLARTAQERAEKLKITRRKRRKRMS